MSDDTLSHVIIVGGGTAGWLTAGILAADHRAHARDGLRVTLVESATQPSLGVGEGTWPSLRDTLRRIGLSEAGFIHRTQASFKQGSRFDGWVDGTPGDSYLHPFDAPPSQDDVDMLSLWRAAPHGTSFADAVSAQARVCAAGLAPKQPQTPEFAAVTNYAYHLDAPAFAELLREHCTARLGVKRILADIVAVEHEPDGAIRALRTGQGDLVSGDLFVDCTGSKSLLVGEFPETEPADASHILFNDAALAIQVPDTGPIHSQTNATAMPAGWIWDIGLQSRRGVGHVFSTRHMSEERAREDLAAYVGRTTNGAVPGAEDARLIRFQSGYRETPWVRNVLAVGMSQGFVEPLEASAIVMIELSAVMLSDLLPPRHSGLATASRRFNERFGYRWARIVDFLKLHYILSRRDDPYWADHRDPETWPARLSDLMEEWRHVPPSRDDFANAMEIFPAASYAYVLYGMGHRTAVRTTVRRKDEPERALRRLGEISAKAQRMLAGLPDNRELLDHLIAGDLAHTYRKGA